MDRGELSNSEEITGYIDETNDILSVLWMGFEFRKGYGPLNDISKLFENDGQQANHIWKSITSEREDIVIENSGKVYSRYKCCNMHGEPWGL